MILKIYIFKYNMYVNNNNNNKNHNLLLNPPTGIIHIEDKSHAVTTILITTLFA
jgi:hypothetical protein